MRKLMSSLLSTALLASLLPLVSSPIAAAVELDPEITAKLKAACKKHERSPRLPFNLRSTILKPDNRAYYTCDDLNGIDDEDERYFKNACKSIPGYAWLPLGAEDSVHTGNCLGLDPLK